MINSNDFYSSFSSSILSALDTHAPIRTVRMNRPHAPWFISRPKENHKQKTSCINERNAQGRYWILKSTGILGMNLQMKSKNQKQIFSEIPRNL